MKRLGVLLLLVWMLSACGNSDPTGGGGGGEEDVTKYPDIKKTETTVACTVDGDCDDGNPCTAGDCGWGGVCVFSPVPGTPCDDANKCTTEDQCNQDGECEGEVFVDCPDDNNQCTKNECDADLGCTYPLEEAGALCDDGNLCTEGDACLDGECSGEYIDCDDENDCTIGSCDQETGFCTSVSLSDMPCNDQNACTNNDSCSDGQCLPGGQVDCDDSNPCTMDTCAAQPKEAGGGCKHQAAIGAPCDDVNPCTAADMCTEAGECMGEPIDCTDDNPCTDDLCNPVVGCLNNPMTGQNCEDGDPCSLADKCQDGVCAGSSTKNCSDGVDCTVDSCHAGGECVHVPDHSACDDGIPCTVESCNVDDGCVSTPDHNKCADGNPCTEDICDLVEQCLHEPLAGYHNGAWCCADSALDCDDGNMCTIDSCNFSLHQCLYGAAPDGVPCEDGLACTQGETCQEGLCGCDDGNHCTVDFCDDDGGCAHEELSCDQYSSVCFDSVCNPGSGECEAEALDCDDSNPCTIDSCDLVVGCVNSPKDCTPPGAEGCNDYTCWPETGDCLATAKECPDSDPCLLECSCNEETGELDLVYVDCGDDDQCTSDDCIPDPGDPDQPLCQNLPVDCDDANACTTDGCDPDVGCVNEAMPGVGCAGDGDCDDGDLCSLDICDTTDTCSCFSAPVDTDDGDCCTIDECDPAGGPSNEPLWEGCRECQSTPDCHEVCPPGKAPDYPETGLCHPEGSLCQHWYCDLNSPTQDECGQGTGRCAFVPILCTDVGECFQECCDPETGEVVTSVDPNCCSKETDPPLMDQDPQWDPEVSVCWDGDLCTIDSCDYGAHVCQYAPLQCFDGDPCTVDSCVPGVGCSFEPIEGCNVTCYNDYDCSFAHGSADDEAGLCSTEQCSFAGAPLGVCLYSAVTCDDGKPCTADSCDPGAGCQHSPTSCEGVPCSEANDCDDGSPCTNDACIDGLCDTFPIGCDDDDPCTWDACNHNTGSCIYKPAANCQSDCAALGGDDACDDGNKCTVDKCLTEQGSCFYSALDCRDFDSCTVDYCDPDDGCVFDPLGDCGGCEADVECDDGNPCTFDTCKAANPASLNDAGYLANGYLHPPKYCSYEGLCTPCQNDEECEALTAGNLCISTAYCDPDNSYCVFTEIDCDDENLCTADACDPGTGQCSNLSLINCCQNDNDCLDQDECTIGSCDVEAKVCKFLTYQCDDFFACTADSCDPETGLCVYEPIAYCTNMCDKVADCYFHPDLESMCVNADCVPDPNIPGQNKCVLTSLTCADAYLCSEDICLPEAGCQYVPPQTCDAPCDGDDDCANGDPCTLAVCDPATNTCNNEFVDCEDGDACTLDVCDHSSGECVYIDCENCDCPSCQSNLDCHDFDACTYDMCVAPGICHNIPVVCKDGNPCTTDLCDPGPGCYFEPQDKCTGCTTNSDCNDNNGCTIDNCEPDLTCSHQDICF